MMSRRLKSSIVFIPIVAAMHIVLTYHGATAFVNVSHSLIFILTVTLSYLVFRESSVVDKKLEEEKKTVEQLESYKKIFNTAEIGFIVLHLENPDDPNTLRIVEINTFALKTAGIPGTVESYSDRLLTETFPGTVQTHLHKMYAEVAKSGKAKNIGEIQYPGDKNSASGFYAVKAFPVNHRGVCVIFENITLKKVSEIALESEKTKNEAILSSIGESVVALDEYGRIILMNPVAEKLFGWNFKDVRGKIYIELVRMDDEHGRIVPPEKRPITQALKLNKRFTATAFLFQKDGTKFPASIVVSPIATKGNILGVVQVVRDITREKDLDRAKNDFISLAAHQLRTPLSAVKWTIDILSEDKNLTAKQKMRLQHIYNSNERLIRLVNDMLNISRIESGELSTVKKEIDLLESVASMVTMAQAEAKKNKQTISLSAPASVRVTIDPTLFNATISNLLSNAITYGYPSTSISVLITPTAKEYVVSVSNHGPQISDAEGEKIFTKFYRGEEARKLKPDGSGLGLFIAKSAVEANGGKIWFESSPKQTTFFFTIPKK